MTRALLWVIGVLTVALSALAVWLRRYTPEPSTTSPATLPPSPVEVADQGLTMAISRAQAEEARVVDEAKTLGPNEVVAGFQEIARRRPIKRLS